MNVSVDVEAVVLARQDHAPVVHQGHVETLSMLHLNIIKSKFNYKDRVIKKLWNLNEI